MTVIGAGGFGYVQAAADVSAPLLEGKSKGLAFALAREAALNPEPAAAAAQPAGGSAPSGGVAQGASGGAPGSMTQFFMDLASGTQAGPKPASALAAEAAYQAARKAMG